jgi:hypothetical protein
MYVHAYLHTHIQGQRLALAGWFHEKVTPPRKKLNTKKFKKNVHSDKAGLLYGDIRYADPEYGLPYPSNSDKDPANKSGLKSNPDIESGLNPDNGSGLLFSAYKAMGYKKKVKIR